jgi:hypothetical protein
MVIEKIKFWITETRNHEVILELDDESDEYDILVYQKDGKFAGDYTSDKTLVDGEFEIIDQMLIED